MFNPEEHVIIIPIIIAAPSLGTSWVSHYSVHPGAAVTASSVVFFLLSNVFDLILPSGERSSASSYSGSPSSTHEEVRQLPLGAPTAGIIEAACGDDDAGEVVNYLRGMPGGRQGERMKGRQDVRIEWR